MTSKIVRNCIHWVLNDKTVFILKKLLQAYIGIQKWVINNSTICVCRTSPWHIKCTYTHQNIVTLYFQFEFISIWFSNRLFCIYCVIIDWQKLFEPPQSLFNDKRQFAQFISLEINQHLQFIQSKAIDNCCSINVASKHWIVEKLDIRMRIIRPKDATQAFEKSHSWCSNAQRRKKTTNTYYFECLCRHFSMRKIDLFVQRTTNMLSIIQ